MIASVDYDSNTPTPTVGGGWSVVDALANAPFNHYHLMADRIANPASGTYTLIATTPGNQNTETVLVSFRWINVAITRPFGARRLRVAICLPIRDQRRTAAAQPRLQ